MFTPFHFQGEVTEAMSMMSRPCPRAANLVCGTVQTKNILPPRSDSNNSVLIDRSYCEIDQRCGLLMHCKWGN